MAFQIVKAEIRTARMIQWFTGICKLVTDFVVGSKMRTKFETLAVELEEQDYQFSVALKQAIPVAIYQAFGFALIPAQKASGTVTFSANPAPSANIYIPPGTQVATVASATDREKVYSVINGVSLLSGQTTVDAQVICTTAGVFGNTGMASVTVIKTNIPGITGVTNPDAFTSGAEIETESARRTRFKEYILSLTRGTASAIEYGAKTAYLTDVDGNVTERVKQASVYDTTVGGAYGFFNCVIYNGSGQTSDNLVTRAQEIIDGYATGGVKVPGYKAAGVVGTVVKATESAVNITLAITAVGGYDHQTIADTAGDRLRSYIAALNVGEDAIHSAMVGIVMGVDGTYACSLTAPAADVAATQSQKLVTGTAAITVT